MVPDGPSQTRRSGVGVASSSSRGSPLPTYGDVCARLGELRDADEEIVLREIRGQVAGRYVPVPEEEGVDEISQAGGMSGDEGASAELAFGVRPAVIAESVAIVSAAAAHL